MEYVDVILPLPLEDSYLYRIPPDFNGKVKPGCRVIVHFGKRKYYTGLVMTVYDHEPPHVNYEIKEIFALLDPFPVLRRPQLRFWQWITSYYLCKLGEVYKAALPAGLKLESETTVTCVPGFEGKVPLKATEQAILDAFPPGGKLTVAELERKAGIRNVIPALTSLLNMGAVWIHEVIKPGFAPKTVTFVRLAPAYRDESHLSEAFASLKRAKLQEKLLLAFLDRSHALNEYYAKEISKKEIRESTGISVRSLDSLVERGILEYYDRETSRLQVPVCRLRPPERLTSEQQQAYDGIHDSFKEKEVCLLQGVASSGKTEIYIHLIEDALSLGRQVLYLLPEIAITTQITERLANYFGEKLLVYHSGFSDNERVEVWNRLLQSKDAGVILGVRSSLFLPFRDLGLIIVDEEQETSYKQQDTAPRYHARNAAIVLARMHGAKTLLGSATPSIDTYYNALTGKYGHVELATRYGGGEPPEVQLVDIKELRRKKIMKDTLFSPLLKQSIEEVLAEGDQVILFQNRRGFAPVVECKACGWVPHCVNCDVSLTYHKYQNRLVCHYCGYSIPMPGKCPECHQPELRMMGFGTEKVEEEVASLFPSVKAERMDMDTARTKRAYERILSDFEAGKSRILIGTQMLSKGLDFSRVGVVGVLNADALMNFPDFRAHERAFQLMVQVSGRAGRRDKRGKVVIQTSQPDHPLLQMIRSFDYKRMAEGQLAERKLFRYPPYYRLIVIVMRSRDETLLQEMSRLYGEKLRTPFGDRVLGPVTPVVNRVQTFFVRKLFLKIEITANVASVREILGRIYREMQDTPGFRQLLVHYDVDPL